MEALTERLEIRVSPKIMKLLRKEGRERSVSVAQIVREAIERMLKEDMQIKMEAAETLFGLEAPVADWPEMKRQIEGPHLGER